MEQKPSNPIEEYGLVKRFLAHAQEVTGVTEPITIDPQENPKGPLGIGRFHDGKLHLVYQVGLTQPFMYDFPADELEAIIAHELGHVSDGTTEVPRATRLRWSDAQKRANEKSADLFAVKFGYGPASIRAFERFKPIATDDAHVTDKTHPSDDQRISYIRSAMAQGVSA